MMEMSLFKREGKTFTKFKVTLKSFYKGWWRLDQWGTVN